MSRRYVKSMANTILFILLIILLGLATGCQSDTMGDSLPTPASTGAQPENDPSPTSPSIQISITGDEVQGIILSGTSVAMEQGDTVLDVLIRVTREHGIPMEFKGRGATAYVEGINNLYEFDHGAKSGWLYRVNGQMKSASAGSYKLDTGDSVEWVYTLDLGTDLGEGNQ